MRKFLPLILIVTACTTNNISQPRVAAEPVDASVKSTSDSGGSTVVQPQDAASSIAEDASTIVEYDAAVTDSAVSVDEDAAMTPLSDSAVADDSSVFSPEDYVGPWSCTYTQTTDISGKTLNPPQGGVVTLSITEPITSVYVVSDALGSSGNLSGNFQGPVLVAQNTQSAYRFELHGTTLYGSWTNLAYPKMLTDLSCTH